MKAIIGVLFFGIMSGAFTPDSPETDKCQQEKAASNFDSSKFFSGTWYVTHAKKISTSVCHQFSTTINGDTVSVTADGYYEIGRKRDFYNVPCTGKITGGKFSLNCQPKKPTSTSKSTINVQVEVTVMETDNTKYALLYRCATSGPHKTENYLVIQRNENEDLPTLKSKVLSGKVISRKQSTNVCRKQ
uniref:Pc64, similar to salivary lipocalin n=1 Tax=Panstrongylus chinai TaxID=156444 RepID=A0A286T5N9_9HEMI|nr:Pc64, similar to salivary lipocalin [Panstrongylus chinai]